MYAYGHIQVALPFQAYSFYSAAKIAMESESGDIHVPRREAFTNANHYSRNMCLDELIRRLFLLSVVLSYLTDLRGRRTKKVF